MRFTRYLLGTLCIVILMGSGLHSLAALQTQQAQYPPDFRVDDLVFFDSTRPPGRWNITGLDHVAIYLGNETFICTTINRTTHELEVDIVNYDRLFSGMVYTNPRYARVSTATPEQRHAATAWALTRIGDPYQIYDPRKNEDPDSSMITARHWYCSELIWAAYYNIGIDIDRNGWKRDFPWFFPLFSAVSCDDIYYDDDIVYILE